MISENIVTFVKQKEGYRKTPYQDGKQISYGYGTKAPSPTATITEPRAGAVLTARMEKDRNTIKSKYPGRFNDNELDSLTSFAYNLGMDNVDQVTNNGRRSNEEIANNMVKYVNFNGKPLDGLVTRRQQEQNIFKTPINDTATSNTYNSFPASSNIPGATPPYTSAAGTANRRPVSTTLQTYDPDTNTGTGKVAVRADFAGGRTYQYLDTNKNELTSVFEGPWAPRANIFQQFATMTYSVSLYLQGPGDYKEMMNRGKKTVKGLPLFIQSAGAKTTAAGAGLFGAIRATEFDDDFYLDNIQFQSMVSGTSTQSMHNIFTLNFTITEPAGLTFLERLSKMVRRCYPEARNYTAHPYLMVIRFYGYDENGKQQLGHELPELAAETFTDNTAVGEKYIPYIMTGATFRLHEDKVDYAVTAVCPNSHIANDRIHGSIPATMRLTGGTLSQVLTGIKAGVKGDYHMVGGLVDALNSHQMALANGGMQEHPDVYDIQFADSIKADTSLVVASGNDKSKYLTSTAFVKPKGSENEISAAGGAIRVDTDKKIFQINKGTKITKIIDFLMQTSSFIQDQLSYKTDPSADKDSRGSKITIVKQDNFSWFKIQTVAIPMFDKWDRIRNDYAYSITYKVSPYKFTSEAAYTKQIKKDCFSVHKEYNYWFTGENTEVLGFKQDFNYLYYMEMSRPRLSKEEIKQDMNNNLNRITKTASDISNSQTELFGDNHDSEVAANVASELYSPGDLNVAEIEIVGDPDFICQSELFYSPANTDDEFITVSPFMRDGSVNFNASEIYFTINYNTIKDYDIATGMADVGIENVGRDISSGIPGISKFSFVYRANIITTRLEGGKFTQKLEGTMKQISPTCTFARNLGDGARREESKNDTTVDISSVQRVNSGASEAKHPKALPKLSDNVPIKPEFKTAALPDSVYAFNTNEALGFNNGRVSRDTPAPLARDEQSQADVRKTKGWTDPNPKPPVVEENPYNTVTNKAFTAGKEFISNTYTTIVTDPINDLNAARKKLFEKIKIEENNPFDEDN